LKIDLRIGLFKNLGGYWQVTVLNCYLSLNFLALFLTSHTRPAKNTEICHYCNNTECCAIGHIDEIPWQDNHSQTRCYFKLSSDDIEKKVCDCGYLNCYPMKYLIN